MAARVELRTALTVCAMECDDLVADEIVPWLQTRRDRIVDSIVGFDHERCVSPLGLQPFGIAGKKTGPGDFEPDRGTICLVVLAS